MSDWNNSRYLLSNDKGLLTPKRRINESFAATARYGPLVIPVALVLIATRLTNGATSRSSGPLPSPAFDATLAAIEDTAYFAGGCFWGIEGVYEHVRGVKSAVSGYSEGAAASPETMSR